MKVKCENCGEVFEVNPVEVAAAMEACGPFGGRGLLPCARPGLMLAFLRATIQCCDNPSIVWYKEEDMELEITP